MSDRIVRGICKNASVRAIAVDARNTAQRARLIHSLSPTATAALGRTLAAASMLGAELKDENASLTLQIRGGGPLGSIVAVSDSFGFVRGYLQNPYADPPVRSDGKLDVGNAVGSNGTLTVIKDLGLKEPFVGSCELVSGEIAEDIAQYLMQSEQIPSAVSLGVLVDRDLSVKHAGGYIISVMPDITDDALLELSEILGKAPPFTTMLESGLSIEDMLCVLLEPFGYETLETFEIGYRCRCTEDRVRRALISLGKTDLIELASGGKTVETTCQFCDKIYKFSPDELFELVRQSSDKNTI